MIKCPSKDKLISSSYFLVFIHFLNHQQKCLLGTLVIFMIVALAFDAHIVLLNLWSQTEAGGSGD